MHHQELSQKTGFYMITASVMKELNNQQVSNHRVALFLTWY